MSFLAGGLIACLCVMFQRARRRARSESLTLEVATQLIQDFVSKFSDQKLHDVFAFCQDGRMEFSSYCECLLGVFSSDVLHNADPITGLCPQECSLIVGCGPDHYLRIKQLPGMRDVETAYLTLGGFNDSQEVRDQRLLGILCEEIARRALRIGVESHSYLPSQVEA